MNEFRFLLSLFFFLSCSWLVHAATPAETQALIDLYNATNGPNWSGGPIKGYTTSSGDPCVNQWTGVICSIYFGSKSVTLLSLSSRNLVGTIPSSFGNLVNLQTVEMDGNKLSGTIPSTIGNLAILVNLFLNDNQLLGTIPSTLGNLSKLNFLDLSGNFLTGTLPSSAPNIQIYDFSNNHFCNQPSWCINNGACSAPNGVYELYSPVGYVSVQPTTHPYSPTLSDLQIQVFGCDSNFANYLVFNPSSISSYGNVSVTVSLSNYVSGGGSNSGYPAQSVVVSVNVISPVHITCSPTPVNITLSSSGSVSVVASSLATASETGGVSSFSYSSNVTSLSCGNLGSNNHLLVTATDPYGNFASCSATANVNPYISFTCLQGVVINLNSSNPGFSTTVSASQVSSSQNPCSLPVTVSPSTVSSSSLSSSSVSFTVSSSYPGSSSTCTATGYVVIDGILNVGSAIRAIGASFIIKWNTSYTSLFSTTSKVSLYYFSQLGSKVIINPSAINYSVGQYNWPQGFSSSLKLNEYYNVFMSINGQVVGSQPVYVIL